MWKLSVKYVKRAQRRPSPQGAGSALEALGVNPNLKGTGKAKHDESTSDDNHPTRAGGLTGLGGWWMGLAGVCSGVFCSRCGCPRCSYTHTADFSAEGFEHVDSFHVAEQVADSAAE